MKRKKMLIGAFGLLILVLVGAIAFMLVQRANQASAAARKPGMMMHNGGKGFAAGPERLIAVSPKGTPVAAGSGSAALPQGEAAQKVGGLNVRLAIAPYPPKNFSASDFSVTLSDENGQPVTGAAISLDLTMPEMPMPVNVVELKPGDAGVYQAQGRFTMRGWWRIEVIIERDGAKQSAFFDLGL